MRERFLREQSGFTLTEMMVTIVVWIVMLLALYSIFDMSIKVFMFGNNKAEAMGNARLGIEKMEREIRQAYGDTQLLNIMEQTEIRFGNDLDGNEIIQCPNTDDPPQCEKIGYQVYETPAGSGNFALGRDNVSTGTTNTLANLQPVVEHVDYVEFTYLDDDGVTEITDPANQANVAFVRMKIGIIVDPGTDNEAVQQLTTDIDLRNT